MSKLIASDATELAYWVHRPPRVSGRLLILLHGVASNHTRWSEFVERTELTSTWNLLRPDLRGNGSSMTRSGQTMSVWCRDLVEILAAENFACGVVVGHSLGAQIAIHLAHRSPDKVEGLVLIDPVFHRALLGKARRWHNCRWLLVGAARVVQALNAGGLRRRRFPSRDIRALDEETRAALRGESSFEAIARKYGALGPILQHMPTVNYLRQVLATLGPLPPLGEIDVPVLALLSGGNTFADLEINQAEINRFPRRETVTLEANHWPLTETPDETRRAIEEWIVNNYRRLE